MKKKQVKFIGALLATVLMAGVSGGAVIAYDEFATAVTPDTINGIYQTGEDFGGTVNSNVTGGTIVGFDETTAWTASTFIEAYADVMRMVKRTYGGTYSGRELTTSMSGKTRAYAKSTMRILSGTGGSAAAGACFAQAGFCANESLGSLAGAAVGYYWDGLEWDLALRYNNGSVSYATIADGVSYDSTQSIHWFMDDAADTIKVWVDTNDCNAVADLTVTDWQGTVAGITHLSAGHSETGDSDVYVYDMQLGDTAADIGMVPPAGLWVYEEFNTSATAPDYSNGIYLSGADLGDPGNSNCYGGSIVGFDETTAWTDSGFIESYANLMRMKARTFGGTYSGRELTKAMGGKSRAYAKATMRIRAGGGGSAAVGACFAQVGFCANGSLGSLAGAAVGYYWDGLEWDLALRYNNGSVSYATIADGVSYDNTQSIYWFMDDNHDTIKVWVDENNPNVAPDLTVTDWQGTVLGITHLSAGHAETGVSDVYVYDMQLGVSAEVIGMVPELPPAGLLVRDEFITDVAVDTNNGIYKASADIGAAQNAYCTGGSIIGFDGTTAWNENSYFDAYAGTLRLLHRTYGASYGGREITADLTGKTVAVGHTHMRMISPAGSATAAYAYAGFGSNGSLGSDGGATVGFNWDNANSHWDLALRYNNGVTAIASNILENITVNETYEIFWKMDDTANTISVWVNEKNSSVAPDLTVGNWGGTITGITHLTAGHSETGTGDVLIYDMELGETPESIGMEVPATEAYAEIQSIEPFSGNVMKLVVSADHPELCYPKSKTSLPTGTWFGIGHSSNGVAPFEVTNLTYSSTSGADYVIYIEAGENEKFIKIGAE